MIYEHKIAKELFLSDEQVRITLNLLHEGASVPFIARYRKERTGGLDEVEITKIRDHSRRLQDIEKRRKVIIKSLLEQQQFSSGIHERLLKAETLSILEDIYLPYKPKRKTRASVAREKGLEALAKLLLKQEANDLELQAKKFINRENGIESVDDALRGARDIIAEIVAENAAIRAKIRLLFIKKGQYVSTLMKGKEEEAQKFKDYFDWSESIKSIASHRFSAMRRGEREKLLALTIEIPTGEAIAIIERAFIKDRSEASMQLRLAIEDSYKRLIKPSMETEVRLLSRQRADEEAIDVFSENVRQLLLAAPLGQKRIMGIDPGFRTGCKVVCLDEQGMLLVNKTIFPHTDAAKLTEAANIIIKLFTEFRVEAIAIGNGTGGRETKRFIERLKLENCIIGMVNESGASIYSASEVAREEFPDYDLTVRGAISIARRLMDPLAELVKIDPQSIGVGQYQHDVDQKMLQQSLDDTVISCVNAIGVSLNTSSKEVLAYVSGLGPILAQNIISYRNDNGPFKKRADLKKVPRLGGKAYEQAAGFLRIPNAKNPLDASAVHPERYELVEKMANDVGCNVEVLLKDEQSRKRIVLKDYINDHIGLPTLRDIMAELAKPGLDPREQFEVFSFTEGINEMVDLKIGMKLAGIVTNITKFGAFVDIGVHQDGLVHLSQMADRFVKDPSKIVKVNQKIEVKVIEVDIKRKRIGLSMKSDQL